MTAPIDVEHSFRQAMSNAGIVTNDPIIADGELHRFHIEGDKTGSKNGWQVLYPDAIPAGAYGDWRDISEKWCSKETSKLSSQERETFTRRMEAAKVEREQERKRVQVEAQTRAKRIWEDAEPAPDSHPYLKKKQVKAHKLRVVVQGIYKGKLVVPLYGSSNSKGTIQSLQFISRDGSKKFLSDGKTSGGYYPMGEMNGVIRIVEGYATGYTVLEAKGGGVAVAFCKDNLAAVAKALRGKYSDAEIIIAGDNDHQTEGNPGKTKAIEAARAVGGLVALPTFQDGQAGTDWNDLYLFEGLEAVRGQLEAAAPPPPFIENPIPTLPPLPGQFLRTDSGNAEYFTHLYGERVRFNCRHNKWLIFKNHYWQPDADKGIMRLAKDANKQRYKEAWDIKDSKQQEAESKHAMRSESRQKLEATLVLAQSELPIADTGEGWDTDPFLLGVSNGVINLGTGELQKGKPEDRISKRTHIHYAPEAKAPRWQTFLEEIFNGDRELIDFIHRAVGYSLTGNITEKCLFMCYGSGDNGKTVFENIIRHIAGDYGYNTGFATLELHRGSTASHDVAHLEGRRLVTASETSEYIRLNEARIKALTGGDPMTARHMYGHEFTFWPVAKFWLATNHLPIVRDDSPGFWGRIRTIPFTQKFIEADADLQLEQTLRKEEVSGILNWAIEGCMMWQEKGLKPPGIVTQATKEYREEQDPLNEFVADCCEIGPDLKVLTSDIYKAYSMWADDQGLKKQERLTKNMFGRKMGGVFKRDRTGSKRMYWGVGLRNGIPTRRMTE